jgi:imidazolonepropionase-like amidohydrolase
MTRHRFPAACLLAIAGCAWWIGAAAIAGQDLPKVHPRPIVIIGGTIIDGTGAPSRRNDAIVIQDGRIKAVGLAAGKKASKDARMIDASARWILPGLIDAAVHLSQTGGLDARPDLLPDPAGRSPSAILSDIRRAPAPYLRAYICAGITGVLNVGGPPWTFDLRGGRADDALSPRIATTGPWLTAAAPAAPSSPGDEPSWAPKDPAALAPLVERLAQSHPDLVALRIDASVGAAQAGGGFAAAAVAAAHARKLRVVVEAGTLAELRAAVESGADAVVSRVFEEIDEDLAQRIVRQQVVFIPAMVVGESYRQVLARDAAVSDIETACAPESSLDSLAALRSMKPDAMKGQAEAGRSLDGEMRNVKRLVDRGVAIVAGSGAGDLRVLHGASLHREFALMADAGLTPMQIILAATRDAARLLGRQSEIGQIKDGMAADVVLLEADPLADIRNTRKVVQVIKGGALYEK